MRERESDNGAHLADGVQAVGHGAVQRQEALGEHGRQRRRALAQEGLLGGLTVGHELPQLLHQGGAGLGAVWKGADGSAGVNRRARMV